jgi:hypothetical protein
MPLDIEYQLVKRARARDVKRERQDSVRLDLPPPGELDHGHRKVGRHPQFEPERVRRVIGKILPPEKVEIVEYRWIGEEWKIEGARQRGDEGGACQMRETADGGKRAHGNDAPKKEVPRRVPLSRTDSCD